VKSARTQDNEHNFFGLFFLVVLLIWMSVTIAFACAKAATTLHQTILKKILRVPMAFFDTTPLGRILNRFSKDQDSVDMGLPIWIR